MPLEWLLSLGMSPGWSVNREETTMPLKKYGVLKGPALGHLRDADDDHYQILIKAGETLHRIAVNVKSSATNAPSQVLFRAMTTVPAPLKAKLRALNVGYKKLASKPGDVAQDYVRGGLVKPSEMKPVPPEAPGVDNDLKDKLESAVVKAIGTPGSIVYAFGEKWGPETNKKDQYFKFKPGNGIHDIHMNQGNSGQWKRDNGVYQDGAIYVEFPNDKWVAFYLAFQSQSFATDNNGHPVRPGGGGAPKIKRTGAKRAPARKGKKPRRARKPG